MANANVNYDECDKWVELCSQIIEELNRRGVPERIDADPELRLYFDIILSFLSPIIQEALATKKEIDRRTVKARFRERDIIIIHLDGKGLHPKEISEKIKKDYPQWKCNQKGKLITSKTVRAVLKRARKKPTG